MATETNRLTVLPHRVDEVRRRIADRRKMAEEYRGEAIGADISTAQSCLRTAEMCENLAEGMERALSMLFD